MKAEGEERCRQLVDDQKKSGDAKDRERGEQERE
jgi:hypothetical protein